MVENLGASFNDSTGTVTGPSYTVGGVTQPTFAAASGALNDRITVTNTAITNIENTFDSGTVGLVQQASSGAPITVGASTGGTQADFANATGTARVLTGVSAGDVSSAASTDVVNGAQLYVLNLRVGGNTSTIDNLFGRLRDISNGAAGLVLQDAGTLGIGVASRTGGNAVDMRGTAGERQLAGVAEGRLDEASTEAVNGAQLHATEQQISAIGGRVTTVQGDIVDIQRELAGLAPIIADGITYDDASKARLTLAGASGTRLTNVAAGAVAAGSMDAVNGGQLFDFDAYFQSQLGDLGNLADDLEKQWDEVEKDIADGTLTPGHFDADAGGDRITNVAPGIADTDGVNVGQLHELVEDAIKQAQNYTDQQAAAFSSSLDGFKRDVDRRFKQTDERLDRVGAMAAASTHMAINAIVPAGYAGQAALGVGSQNGKSAVSAGYAMPVGRQASLSVGGTFSGPERSTGIGLSVSF